MKKSNEVESQLSDSEINKYIKGQKGLNEKQKELLKTKSEQVWFRQYARNSKGQLQRLTKTVKKQIKSHKGEYYSEQRKPAEDLRGVIEPKRKRLSKQAIKSEVAQKLTRKEKEQIKQNYRVAPSGRKLTYTEIHEGSGSKRAYAEREKKGFKANDFYDRKGNTTYKKEE